MRKSIIQSNQAGNGKGSFGLVFWGKGYYVRASFEGGGWGAGACGCELQNAGATGRTC